MWPERGAEWWFLEGGVEFPSRSPESPPPGRGTNEVSQFGSRSPRGEGRRCSEAGGRSPAPLPSQEPLSRPLPALGAAPPG